MWLFLFALLVAILAVLPYALHTQHPLWQGVVVLRDEDYANYFSRLQRSLSGYPFEASNGITSVSEHIPGLQIAGMEIAVGFLFQWTGLPAPVLGVLLSGAFGAVLFLLFFQFFRELKFSNEWSLGLVVAIFIAMFHGLTRVVQPGWTFVPAVASLVLFLRFLDRPRWTLLVVTAVLLGVLPYLYFWHWTFVYASVASIVCLFFLARRALPPWSKMVLLGVLTLLIALPFCLHTWSLSSVPFYPEIAIRASFLHQRFPESWPRSILLCTQLIVLLSLWKSSKGERGYLLVSGLLIGIVLAMHQNILHNQVLMFASHYQPHFTIVTLVVGAWACIHAMSPFRRWLIIAIAVLLFAASARDYAFAHAFFAPRYADFRYQHLHDVFPQFQDQPEKDVLLSDAVTSRVVTSFLPVGIVYTGHMRFLLMSDAEMAERYCLSIIAAPTIDSFRALYIEYNRILDSKAMRLHEKQLVGDACAKVRHDPRAYLKKFHVTHILWNSELHPDWKFDTDRLHVKKVASGSGWMLWRTTP